MSENVKSMKGRFQNKHKTEAKWWLDVYDTKGNLRSDAFIPLNGELIVFDEDEWHNYKRFKFGDGQKNVIELGWSSGVPLYSVTKEKHDRLYPFEEPGMGSFLHQEIKLDETASNFTFTFSAWNIDDYKIKGYIGETTQKYFTLSDIPESIIGVEYFAYFDQDNIYTTWIKFDKSTHTIYVDFISANHIYIDVTIKADFVQPVDAKYIPIDNETIVINENGVLKTVGGGSLSVPISAGEGENSIIINEGIAKGKYSIAGGAVDTSIIQELTGLNPSDYITIKEAEASGILSKSYGTNTEAIAHFTTAEGFACVAGIKGYYINKISTSNYGVRLSKKQSVYSKPDTIDGTLGGWKVGDWVSLHDGDRLYPMCGKIASISGEYIYLDRPLPFDELQYSILATLPYHRCAYAVYNYECTHTGFLHLSEVCEKANPIWKCRGGEVVFGHGASASGIYNMSLGQFSTTLHQNNLGAGDFSFVIGRKNVGGVSTFVSGSENWILADDSHGEGYANRITRTGFNAHVEGRMNTVRSNSGHAGGSCTEVRGSYAFAHGLSSNRAEDAVKLYNENRPEGVAEVDYEKITDGQARTLQTFTIKNTAFLMAKGEATTALGINTLACTSGAMAIGKFTYAKAEASFASGYMSEVNTDNAKFASAFGEHTKMSKRAGMAIGKFNKTSDAIFVIGNGTSDSDRADIFTITDKGITFGATAKTYYADALAGGIKTGAKEGGCFAWGISSNDLPSGVSSLDDAGLMAAHKNAKFLFAKEGGAIALGKDALACSPGSFACGNGVIAKGGGSVALGHDTKAIGIDSMAVGLGIETRSKQMFGCGRYNASTECAFVVGNGSSSKSSDAFKVDWSGNTTIAGSLTTGSLTIGSTTITETELKTLLGK